LRVSRNDQLGKIELRTLQLFKLTTEEHTAMSEDLINESQRAGSITGIGIVLGFSLAFISRFSFGSSPWRLLGAIVALVAGVGIIIQMLALFRALSIPMLSVVAHKSMVRKFIVGVSLVLLGFFLHVAFDFIADKGWNVH
jgi:hypothetical protein